MTILENQVKDWETLHKLFKDAQALAKPRQTEYLHAEVYPKLREYVQKYATKYDHLNRPR